MPIYGIETLIVKRDIDPLHQYFVSLYNFNLADPRAIPPTEILSRGNLLPFPWNQTNCSAELVMSGLFVSRVNQSES